MHPSCLSRIRARYKCKRSDRVRVRVQIHQHDTQVQRTNAEFGRFPFYHCIGRHSYLFPELTSFKLGLACFVML